MKWLVLLMLLIPTAALSDPGFFVEAGVAYHPNQIDCPEYCGTNPLLDVGAGYTFGFDNWNLDLYVKHRSSAPDVEDGFGHNLLGVRVRWYPGTSPGMAGDGR